MAYEKIHYLIETIHYYFLHVNNHANCSISTSQVVHLYALRMFFTFLFFKICFEFYMMQRSIKDLLHYSTDSEDAYSTYICIFLHQSTHSNSNIPLYLVTRISLQCNCKMSVSSSPLNASSHAQSVPCFK